MPILNAQFSRGRWVGVFLGLLVSAMLSTGTVWADGKWCKTDVGTPPLPPAPANPQNVLIFVLDDTTTSALPTFNRPIEWPDPNNPPSQNTGTTARLKHLAKLRKAAQRQRPDLNYFAARSNALSPSGDLGTVVPSDSGETPAVPLDLDKPGEANETAESFTYSKTETNMRKNVLSGYGGLGKLAREGISFSRYYSTAALCSPARSSIMTGRYPTQVGVGHNKAKLESDEIVFSNFLDQMCHDGGACYTAAHFGKWHLGNEKDGKLAPWMRGARVAMYDTSNSRSHWDRSDLVCGPLSIQGTIDQGPNDTGFYCTDESLWLRQCTNDWECNSNTSGDPCYVDGACACSHPKDDGEQGHCYRRAPTPCNPTDSGSCGNENECVRWETYFGSLPDQVGCHPKDQWNPLCCSDSGLDKFDTEASGTYQIARKTKQDGSDLFSHDRGSSGPCSNSSAGFTDTGCHYDTRFYRDMLVNFIAREGHGQTLANKKRFIAYYAPHATHSRSSAPGATREHYTTLPNAENANPSLPNDHADAFWAALEEIDATIGSVLEELEGFCDSPTPSQMADGNGSYYGKACVENDECGIGYCNHFLRDNTLVLFTADHGTPDWSYGEPWLTGGKNSTFEGGLRVGLTAWGPGLGIGQSPLGHVDNVSLGSHVDIFATVAHAAGCRPTEGLLGYKIGICSGGTAGVRRACSVSGDCGGGTCQMRPLEGRSLLPVISGTMSTAYSGQYPTQAVDYMRQLAYAHWSGNKPPSDIVIARAGYAFPNSPAAAARVCSLRAEAEPFAGTNADSDTRASLGVVRTGSSCKPCDNAGQCGATRCYVNGTFCVPDTEVGQCTDASFATQCPDWVEYHRCEVEGDCVEGKSCVELTVPCEQCELASWKYSAHGSDLTSWGLFDVASNPEEGGTKKLENNELNCIHEGGQAGLTNADVDKLMAVKTHLHGKLSSWWQWAQLNNSDHRAEY